MSNPCTFFIKPSDTPPNLQQIKDKLQNGTIQQKCKFMKSLVKCLVSDQTYPPIIMQIISNIIPVQHKSPELRKVMLLYWEVIDKCKSPTDRTLKEEIFLACNSLRNDLLCHNEYVRGRTLRLISRIMHRGVIEPLSSAISSNLEHKSSYVRRNTVVCMYNVFNAFGSDIIGDIDDEIEQLLQKQTDLSTKRNAFLLLQKSNPEKALNYIQQQINFQAVDQIGDILQLAILKILKLKCKQDSSQKPKLLRIVNDFSSKATESVKLQCALTSTAISNSAQTIKSSLYAYVTILAKTNELNVKKIILDRLELICKNSNYLEEDLIQDLLKGLETPSIDIKQKIVQIIITGITLKTSSMVLEKMKWEIVAAKEDMDYMVKIIRVLEIIVFKFPSQHSEILLFLFSHVFGLSSIPSQGIASLNNLIKKILEDGKRKSKEADNSIKTDILNNFGQIKCLELIKVILNLFGSYYTEAEHIQKVINKLKVVIGPLPISVQRSDKEIKDQKESMSAESSSNKQEKKIFRTVVLEDGTYSTELVHAKEVKISEEGKAKQAANQKVNLTFRNAIAEDSIVGGVFSRNIGKLLYKIRKNSCFNKQACSILMILCSIIRYYEENISTVDQAVIEEISLIIRKIINPQQFIQSTDLDDPIFNIQVAQSHEPKLDNSKSLQGGLIEKNPEDMINFRLLKKGGTSFNDECQFEFDEQEINEITDNDNDKKTDYVSKLKSLVQLTGQFDPIYSEAFVTVNKYDIIFEVTLSNKAKNNLSNVQVEFSSPVKTLILEKALTVNLRPNQTTHLRTQIRFSGAEFGVIYGYINYDNHAGLQQPYLITEQINIDYMQFIQPSRISEEDFKVSWQRFSFEAVKQIEIPSKGNTKNLFNHIIQTLERRLHAKRTMQSLQSLQQIESAEQLKTQDDTQDQEYFMNWHLYGKSKLGEDFMVNVALFAGQKITATVTVRSKDEAVMQIVVKELDNCKFDGSKQGQKEKPEEQNVEGNQKQTVGPGEEII